MISTVEIKELANKVRESSILGKREALKDLKYLESLVKSGIRISDAPGTKFFQIKNQVFVNSVDVDDEDSVDHGNDSDE